MVHRRERYIAGWMPRVNGGSPGGGVTASRSRGRSSAPNTTGMGMPLVVARASAGAAFAGFAGAVRRFGARFRAGRAVLTRPPA
jgi:hypothetical protein